MSCHIKNGNSPVQIQCSFPEVVDGKGDFSVYLNSLDGPAAPAKLIVSCTYNEKYACIEDEAVVTPEDLNKATITLTETLAKKNGTFSCQRGDIPITEKCQFPFSENVNPLNSFSSKVDRGTTTHGIFTLKPEQFKNGDDNTETIVGAVIGVSLLLVVILVIFILCRRLKLKKRRKRPGNSNKDKSPQSIKVVNEGKKTTKQLRLKNQLEKLIKLNTPKETKTQISSDEQGSTLNKPQKNGGMEDKSAESKRNDSGSGLEKESGSFPSGNEESSSPLMSSDTEKNQPI